MVYMREVLFSETHPEYSICMPIYNQEEIISRVLNGLVKCTHNTYEIIMIADCCSDGTVDAVNNWINNLTPPANLCRIVFHTSTTPLFETACDNICFKSSKGTYLLEIQADMEMTQDGYNTHLVKPFHMFSNVIAVGGRCGWSWTNTDCIGKTGTLLEQPLDSSIDTNTFYIAESTNRGPLLFDHTKLKEMGYLDEKNYFLGGDEHDVLARAFFEKGYICGYVPIEFNSDLRWGSTRKGRDAINSQVLARKRSAHDEFIFMKHYANKTPRRIQKVSMLAPDHAP